MNKYARFDEIPSMTPKDIKESKRYGRTDGRTDNVKTVYPPPQTQFVGGIIIGQLLDNWTVISDFVFTTLDSTIPLLPKSKISSL